MRISMRMSPALFATTSSRYGGQTIHAAGGNCGAQRRPPAHRYRARARRMSSGYCRAQTQARREPGRGARREVIEETGPTVFGCANSSVPSRTGRAGRPKVVQFWRMQAEANPSRDLMEDIMAGRMAAAPCGHSKVELSSRELVSSECRPEYPAFATQDPRPQIKIAPCVKSTPTSCRIASAQTHKDFGGRFAGNDAAACARDACRPEASAVKIRRPARNPPQTLRKFNLRKPTANSIPNGAFMGHSRANGNLPFTLFVDVLHRNAGSKRPHR